MKENENITFYDLTPTDNIELDIYEKAINFSLENNKILNIAISGSYGSGKSSLLESYKKNHPEKKFLNISLIHFNTTENTNKNKIYSAESDNDNKDSKTQPAEAKRNNSSIMKENSSKDKSLVPILEVKILNQLIHQISYEKIPQTHFKTKRKFTEEELENTTMQILLFIASLLYVIYFNKWNNFISTLKDSSFFYSLLKLTTYSYFRLISILILFYLLGIFIYNLLKFQKTKNFFKKLNIQGNEIEISEDNNDSYFDKYLNEVIYLFENSGVEAIVFEDIDRYEVSEIFERLREVNKLVNNKLMIKKLLYYLNEHEISFENLKERNFSLISHIKENELLKYIKKDINKYAKIILENCEGKIDDDEKYIIEFLNLNDIEEENKCKYTKFLTKSITDISKIKNKNLWEIFFSNNKINYSEENIITYFKEFKLNETLIQFINLKYKKLSFKNFKFDDNDTRKKFTTNILRCYKINNEIYINILTSLKHTDDEIEFPKDIPEEKINALINANIIKMSSSTLTFIRTYYKNSLYHFIKLKLNSYIDIIKNNNILFYQNELLAILSDKSIKDKIKLKLLKFSEENIDINNKNYSDEINKFILDNNLYNINELIENFSNFNSLIKEKIYKLVKENIDDFYNNLEISDFELIKSFFTDKEIDIDSKLKILINILDNRGDINSIEDFYKYLELMNLEEYKNITKKNLTLQIPINDFNRNLLQELKYKDFIEDFSQINETIYEVITTKED